MSDTKWCIKTRSGAVYGPFDGSKEAYEYISKDTDMRKIDVRPMRGLKQAEDDL